ncbi:hypothetical protein MUP32_04925, partial [Candidatus Microgenomates bacterium]|nr:hypothetical protein [Candidatus Microgenomates bacterium]
MELLIFLLLISFTIRTIRNVLYQTFLWQLKEYRTDRFWSHLATVQGKKLIFGPLTVIKWILLLLIIFGLFEFGSLGFIAYLIFGLCWFFETVICLRELVSRGWKIPVLTVKALIILFVVFFFQFIWLFTGGLLCGPFLDKLLAPSIALLVILTNIPSFLYRKIIIAAAKKKISGFGDLRVIGITGSYGKTSTKEFLATILSEKYKVAK